MNKAVEHARHAAESAQQWVGSVGDTLRRGEAAKWLEAGLKIGVLRTGVKAVGGFARRHPAVAIATVAGAGLLWYAAYRRRQHAADGRAAEGEAIEGQARRIEARRAAAPRRRSRAARTRAAVTPGAE